VGLATATAGKSSFKAKHSPPYTFVVSNNFLGNDWRPQVEKLATLTSKLAPFKGKVSVKIVNSQSTNQAQIADLNSIIQTKPDAIMLIPGSSTALNPTIRRACNAGILVFTISAPVTEKCVWNVNQDFYGGMTGVGQWMGKVLKNQGSVFVDHGIPGLGISKDIENGFRAGLKQYGPKVKVSGTFNGMYAPGPEQSGISSLLVGNPKVNGVMTQGYCTPVFNAFKQAGKDPVPATCYGYNGELGACAQPGHACAILSGSPVVMQIAMKVALDVLDGKPAPPKSKIIPVPMTLFISATPKVSVNVPGVKVEVLKKGVNFFPNLPPGLALPYTLPQYPIAAKDAVGKK
jgi:ribose transport system substrate-binding protein